MTTGKRLLSVLMCVAMLMSMMATFAFADTTETEAPEVVTNAQATTGANPTTDVQLTIDENVYVVDKTAVEGTAYTLSWNGTEYADMFTYGTNLFTTLSAVQAVAPVGATILVKSFADTGKTAFSLAANFYTEAYNTLPFTVGTAFDGSDWSGNADYDAKTVVLNGIDFKIIDAAKAGTIGLYGFAFKYGNYAIDLNNTKTVNTFEIHNAKYIPNAANRQYMLCMGTYATAYPEAKFHVKNFYVDTTSGGSVNHMAYDNVPSEFFIDGLYMKGCAADFSGTNYGQGYGTNPYHIKFTNWNIQNSNVNIVFPGNGNNWWCSRADAGISGAQSNEYFRAVSIENCIFNESAPYNKATAFYYGYFNALSKTTLVGNRIINTSGTVAPFLKSNSPKWNNHFGIDMHDNYIVGYTSCDSFSSNLGNGTSTGIVVKDNYFTASTDVQGTEFYIDSSTDTKDIHSTSYYLDADMEIKNGDLAKGVSIKGGMVAANGTDVYAYVPSNGDYEIVAKEGYQVEYDLGSVTVSKGKYSETYNLNIVNFDNTPITEVADTTGLIDGEKVLATVGEANSFANFDVIDFDWKGVTYSAIVGVNAFKNVQAASDYASANGIENPSILMKSVYQSGIISGEIEYNAFTPTYPAKYFTQNYDKKPYIASDRATDPDGSDWVSNVNTGKADSFNTADGMEIKWFGLSQCTKGKYEFYGFTITNCIQDSDPRVAENQIDVLFQNTYVQKDFGNAIFLTYNYNASSKFATYESANTYFDKVYFKDAYVKNASGVSVGFFEDTVRVWRDLTLDGIFVDYNNNIDSKNHWFDALSDSHNFTIKNSNFRNAQYRLMFEGDNGSGVDKGENSDAIREFEKAVNFDNNIFYNFTLAGAYTGAFAYVKQCYHTIITFTNNFVYTGKETAVNLINGQAGDNRRPNTWVRVDNNTLLGINSLYPIGRWVGTTAPFTSGTSNNFVTDEIIAAEDVLAGNITATGDVFHITPKSTQTFPMYDKDAWYDYARTIKVGDLADYHEIITDDKTIIERNGDVFTVKYDEKSVPVFTIDGVTVTLKDADGNEVAGIPVGTYTATASKVVDGFTFTKDYTVNFVAENREWNVTDGVLTINVDLGNFSSKNTPWYENADEITKVVVAEGVTALGDWALSYLKNVEEVILPESLKTIGRNTFYRNEKLTEITIPEGVEVIGNGAFAYCYKLNTIALPESITTIAKLAFCDCNKLETVNYAGTLDMWNGITIGTGNEALTDCYPPSTVEKVFEWNVTDGVLTISGNVKMEDYASKAAPWFDKADEITKVVIEDGIKSIGANAFAYLRNLEEVEIADTVTSIGGYAFYGCTLLKEVDIPDNVTYLGSAAFAYCKSLKKVTVPAGVKTLYKYTFIDNYVLRTAIYEGDFATLTVLVGNDDFVNANRVEIPEAKVNNLGEVTVPVAGEEYTLETAYCFTPTEKFEDVNANSEYKYYHADFVVTFDKDITDVALAGYYKEYALAVNSADWVPMILQNKKAGEETRLLRDMWFGTDGSISYQELCMIEKFLCGALDLNDNDTGVKMTVELRLYEVTENAPQTDVETGEYVTVGSYTYTF